MSLENCILIKFRRAESGKTIQLGKREAANANDGVIYSLFEQAKQQLNRSAAKQFGFFDKDADQQEITGLIKNWQANTLPFVSFANKLADVLQQQLEETPATFEAALLVAQESLLGQNLLYCFWLPFIDSIQMGHDLEPQRSHSIDTSHLPYAFRLQLDEWQAGESPKYLTLLTQRGDKDMSEAFARFCNFSEGIDLPKQTHQFLQILDTYSDVISQEKTPEEAKTAKLAALNYCVARDKIGETVVLADIAAHLDKGEPTKFIRYVEAQEEVLPVEIHTDRKSLKRYMRYFGRDNSLSISFSAERFGADIKYDSASGSLNILQLPKNLKQQLSGYEEKKS